MPNRRRGAARPLPPTDRDRAIIRDVARHGQMTRVQIRRLHFRRGEQLASVQVVCRRLTLLTERRYLSRIRLPVAMGSGLYVYQLGEAAAAALDEQEGGLIQRRRGRSRRVSAAGMLHTLEIVDFYIALKEALQGRGGEIVVWLSERQAHYAIPCRSRSLPFTPDAYCLWTLSEEEGSFFLEWDRGTESMTRIAEKLTRYETYYGLRAYRDHLGEIDIRPRILFVVSDDRRKKKLTGWIGRGLTKGEWASLPTILVATREHAHSQPLEPIWQVPGGTRPRRLVD